MNDTLLCGGLFGKTRQAVLALLYGQADSSFYTKQILDAVKIGRGTVQRELKNLTDAGIITREVQGRQVYYRANEKCPLFNELKSIVRKTFGIADVIRQSLEPIADKIQVAFIFGSIASGTEQRTSDIDVMVIGETTFDEVVSAISQAEETIQREINSVVYPVAEFRKKIRSNHHFLKTVLEGETIFLIGDDGELARLVK
ncbi:MAG: nucleotidyltransferase domain-containing protein [Chloroflexi bacterium]|jgi:predicted nucleotidyltransferase|nr:nucleotidyltransferase domain-containing protein [Chloroflexota bacterium]